MMENFCFHLCLQGEQLSRLAGAESDAAFAGPGCIVGRSAVAGAGGFLPGIVQAQEITAVKRAEFRPESLRLLAHQGENAFLVAGGACSVALAAACDKGQAAESAAHAAHAAYASPEAGGEAQGEGFLHFQGWG